MAEILSAVSLALTIFDKAQAYYHQYHGSDTIPVDVDQAKRWLTEMQASLRDSENQIDGGSDLLQQCAKHVENTAYDIEDALADYLLHIPDRRGFSQRMHNLFPFLPGNEVKNAGRKLSSDMNRIMQNKDSYKKLEARLRESSSSTRKEDWPENIYLAEGDEIVDFEKHNEELRTQLRGADNSRLTILIAGPGGSGKSTMVKNIYHHRTQGQDIRSNEDIGCHAWVHVPDMEMEELFRKILNQIEATIQDGKLKKYEENDAREKLKPLLQKKKFLIVIDNVWSNIDLDIIIKALPNGLPGSKIIITSRHSDVTRTSLAPDYVHDLSSGLSEDKAKDLFCRKAFRNRPRDWPSIIEEMATKILGMCEGMPLAISAIGTFLAGKPLVPVDWKWVSDSLGSQICADRNSNLYRLFRNLQPSYRDLPSNQKTCFLYFSMFPRGYFISREMLIRLWVAEGFVTSETGRPDEQVAADILDGLVNKNMVVARTVEVHGRLVRRYRVLHLVREINISRRKSFLTVLEPNYIQSGEIIRRLAVNNGPILLINGRTTRTRTLLVFGLESNSPGHVLGKILETSKFLRVLDLQGVTDLKKFPDHVVGLTLLKYLSLKGTQIRIVPKSIKKLVDLEFLDLRQTSVTTLPDEICNLVKLRHLLVFCKDVGSSGGVDLSPRILKALSSVQKLSCIKVKNIRGILTALGELLPGLRKLGLTDLEREDGKELCSSIQNMQHLSTLDVRAASRDIYLDLDQMIDMTSPLAPRYLQHLYMEGRLEMVPRWILELTSLKKIGLKWSKLKNLANPLEPLQDLPNLTELDLIDYCTGEELIFGGNTFQKLMILRMEQFDELKSMIVEDQAMSQLKKLTMRRCMNLRVLPDGIGGLNSLDEFRWNDMHDEFITMLQTHGQRFRIIHS